MKNNDTCKHGGVSPTSLLAKLHDSQAGSGRHRCPTCAYEQGFNLGSSGKWHSYEEYCILLKDSDLCQNGSIAPSHILSMLGPNQGGPGRHKCTNCAFKQGFVVGVLENDIQGITIEKVAAPNPQANPRKSIITSSKIDYVEKEIRNIHLGQLGELFILKSEIEYLKSNGREDLANNIQHVSVEKGDGMGYDILSYDLSGNEKMIEVKTTRSDISRVFYLTKNELKVSSIFPDKYYLYRLFDFNPETKEGQIYIISGDLNKSLTLDALIYVAYPKANNSK